MLVRAVVVRGDRAGAEVDALAERRVADVGEVVGLGAVAERGVLDLDEVADVDVAAERRAGAQARERSNRRARADARAERLAVDVREGPDRRAGGDGRVLHQAVRADAHAVAELDPTFEDAADVDLDVLAADELATLVEARRIGEPDAAFHQPHGGGALVAPLEVGELDRAVDAEDLGLARGGDARHRDAGRDRQADDVGEVVLAGGVVVAQLGEPALERARRRGHHAGVDLADRTLGLARVLLLDDADDAVDREVAAAAHDPAVSARLGQLDRQQRELRRRRGVDEALQRLGLDQRHIAVEDQRHAVVVKQRRGLLQRVSGAELRLLAHEGQAGRTDARLDLIRAVTGDDDDPLRPQSGSGRENVLQ